MTKLQPRKFKINKKFNTLPKEKADGFYRSGIFEFNVTKLLIFIKANPEIFHPEKVPVKFARTFPPSSLDESTIQTANLAEPIILAEIYPERFNIIDGNHRLEKAYRDGAKSILAYKEHAEQHIAFLTSVSAYVEYIEYWNSKKAQLLLYYLFIFFNFIVFNSISIL